MTSTFRPLAALAMVALMCAGCSSAPSETGESQNATNHAKAVKFAVCMRANGVRAFPDPEASGGLTIDGVLNGSSLDADSAAWKTAIAACKDLQPPGFTGHKAGPQEQKGRLRFAQCIRENGVKDFPDPANGEPMVNTYLIPSANAPGGMSILNAAMQKCRSFGPQAAAGQ